MVPVIQSEALDGEVGTTARGLALGGHDSEKSDGAAVLIAGVLRTSDLRRPALEALPNLSLNVSDALSATRAD